VYCVLAEQIKINNNPQKKHRSNREQLTKTKAILDNEYQYSRDNDEVQVKIISNFKTTD